MELKLTRTKLEALRSLSYILDVEESEKLCHCWRVAVMAKTLGEQKCEKSILELCIAGLLHDIGTCDLPNRLIHYKRHFENSSMAEIRVHPQRGAAIASSLPGFIEIAKIILDHHEWVNGRGYPRGLYGDQISLESQILRIADKFAFLIDAEKSLKISDIKRLVVSRIGNEFSKELYDCLIGLLEENNLWESLVEKEKLAEITEKMFLQLPVVDDEVLEIDKDILSFFGRVLDAKHSYTEGHSRRVSYFSTIIALAMGLKEERIKKIELAAFLHDIGKLGIPKSILDKKSRLTIEEFEIIKKHASFSRNIIEKIPGLDRLSHIVGSDQEHWDGSGYPQKLSAEQIPLEARIIFVADAFDAMTSTRSYHKAMSVAEAIEELKKGSSKDFDPEVAAVAIKMFEGFKNPSVLACYVDSASSGDVVKGYTL